MSKLFENKTKFNLNLQKKRKRKKKKIKIPLHGLEGPRDAVGQEIN
jgi:hypothetical protein